MKKIFFIISFSFIIIGALFFIYLYKYFTPFSCGYLLEDTIESPNGNYAINNVIKDCGTREYSQHLFLSDLQKNKNNNEYGELIASHSSPKNISVSWDDDFSIAVNCDKNGLYFHKEEINGIKINFAQTCF